MTTPGDDDRTPPPPRDPFPHEAKSRDERRGLIAPIAAALVLVGGIGFLIVSSGTDQPEQDTPSRIAEVSDPDAPLIESTVPFRTSPPLIGTATTVDDITVPTVTVPTATTTTSFTTSTLATPTTLIPGTGGPTEAQLVDALLGIGDIGPGDWTEEVPEFEDVCGTVLDEEVPDARADSLFQTTLDESLGVRQISNTLLTFPTDEIAARAFDGDLELLIGCDATTIDLDGVQYRVQVDNDAFTEDQAAAFPCADQTAFLIVQLTNESSLVPYIGQSSVSFRCGRNITITALTSTVAIGDLNDENYFNAAGLSNIRVGDLPGS